MKQSHEYIETALMLDGLQKDTRQVVAKELRVEPRMGIAEEEALEALKNSGRLSFGTLKKIVKDARGFFSGGSCT